MYKPRGGMVAIGEPHASLSDSSMSEVGVGVEGAVCLFFLSCRFTPLCFSGLASWLRFLVSSTCSMGVGRL